MFCVSLDTDPADMVSQNGFLKGSIPLLASNFTNKNTVNTMTTLGHRITANPKNYGFKRITKKQFEMLLSEHEMESTEVYFGTAYRVAKGSYMLLKRTNFERASYWGIVRRVFDVEQKTEYGWEIVTASTNWFEAKDLIATYRQEQPGWYRINQSYELKM